MRRMWVWLLLLISSISLAEPPIHITHQEAMKIGVKIWYNESAGKVAGLTYWDKDENFASLGIGHFTWYPFIGHRAGDTFPDLIKFMEAKGVRVPTWLQGSIVRPCPWNSREELLQSFYSPPLVELRRFLLDTIPYQVEFMIRRMELALPRILQSAQPEDREYVREQFYLIASTPQGVYALVDYINFKGEGVVKNPYFSGENWGLLEVLQTMRLAPEDMNALQAFVWSANQVLTRHALIAPPDENALQWLGGWRNRLKTYLE
ncbi:MAG: hypothetical protein WBE18_06240 [Gammaproteobacteria bacterium]